MNSVPEPLPAGGVASRGRLHERLIAAGVVDSMGADRTDLVYNLTKLVNRMSQESESVHRKLGWSWSGFRILNLLWALGPIEARILGPHSGASRATISSLLTTLERDGLVSRERSKTDRRQVFVSLTPEGAERLKSGLRAQAELDKSWFAPLEPHEQAVLGELLLRLADQKRPRSPGRPAQGA